MYDCGKPAKKNIRNTWHLPAGEWKSIILHEMKDGGLVEESTNFDLGGTRLTPGTSYVRFEISECELSHSEHEVDAICLGLWEVDASSASRLFPSWKGITLNDLIV